MDDKDLITYLELFEIAGSDKLKIDDARKRRLRSIFKKEIKKISVTQHTKVEKETKKLHERVDRLFLPQ